MQRVSATEAARISELADSIGPLAFRTLLTQEGSRLVRPERLSHLEAGTGRLSASERERLALIGSNRNELRNLSRKGPGKQEWKNRRAMRDWLVHGKEKGVPYKDQDKETRDREQKAIKALRRLGVDPTKGIYYVRRRK